MELRLIRQSSDRARRIDLGGISGFPKRAGWGQSFRMSQNCCLAELGAARLLAPDRSLVLHLNRPASGVDAGQIPARKQAQLAGPAGAICGGSGPEGRGRWGFLDVSSWGRAPFLLLTILSLRAELPALSTISPDLKTPTASDGPPATGRRVRQTAPGWERTAVHHTLYLPTNWKPGAKFPLLVEYAGNGGYTNKPTGDISLGTVEGSNLGYGISGGSNYIWICMPFVDRAAGTMKNAVTWWGDVNETVAYCTNTVRFICTEFGGDQKAIVLCGFSRGAIACNFIGLHDDGIAPLWRAFIAHSHYDGVNTNWPYTGADRVSARSRLQRLRGRPQFISHEGSIAATEALLRSTGIVAPFTYEPIPFRNHSDQWVLRNLPARQKLRTWLHELGLP